MVSKMVALETSSVSIETATVTIRALQVGKKQMTHSVFKQLPYVVLFDLNTLELSGIPWGWVNYRWNGVEQNETQFVVQKGIRLFRSSFWVCESRFFEHGSEYFDHNKGLKYKLKEMRPYPDFIRDYCRRWDLLMERLRLVEQLYIAC